MLVILRVPENWSNISKLLKQLFQTELGLALILGDLVIPLIFISTHLSSHKCGSPFAVVNCRREPTMTTQPTNQPDPQSPVLLSLGHKDTHHLLEVYVTRRLSLSNRSPLRRSQSTKASKFNALAKALKPGTKRSSSDGSAYSRRLRLGNLEAVPASIEFSPAERFRSSYNGPDRNQRRSGREEKNRSVLKRFLGYFSRKGREEEENREPSPERTTDGPGQPIPSRLTPEPPGNGEQDSKECHTSMRKRCSLLRLPLHSDAQESAQIQRPPSFRILPGTGLAEGEYR